LGALAWRKDAESLYKIFVPIGRRILSALAIRGKKWITG
jgi:hypothetical protein